MRKGEALLRVKVAEKEVEEMKKRAFAEKERILKEARMEVLRLQEEYAKKAEERFKQIVEKGEMEIKEKKSKILEEGRREAEAIRQRGQAKIETAVSLLLKRFEEGVIAVPTQRDV